MKERNGTRAQKEKQQNSEEQKSDAAPPTLPFSNTILNMIFFESVAIDYKLIKKKFMTS